MYKMILSIVFLDVWHRDSMLIKFRTSVVNYSFTKENIFTWSLTQFLSPKKKNEKLL